MDEDQARQFGNYLRHHREAAGFSAQTLASECGIKNKTQIIRLEQGKVFAPRVDVIMRIADVLRLDSRTLLDMVGYPQATVLPALRPYMRQKYRHLPPEAIDQIEDFANWVASQHTAGGPQPGEDEFLTEDTKS